MAGSALDMALPARHWALEGIPPPRLGQPRGCIGEERAPALFLLRVSGKNKEELPRRKLL